MEIAKEIMKVIGSLIPLPIIQYVIKKSMINELFAENPTLFDETIVVLGDAKLNLDFYRKLKNEKISAMKCTERQNLIDIFKKNKEIISKRDYFFIITGKDYAKWAEILETNGISMSRYVVFPLFVSKEYLKPI